MVGTSASRRRLIEAKNSPNSLLIGRASPGGGVISSQPSPTLNPRHDRAATNRDQGRYGAWRTVFAGRLARSFAGSLAGNSMGWLLGLLVALGGDQFTSKEGLSRRRIQVDHCSITVPSGAEPPNGQCPWRSSRWEFTFGPGGGRSSALTQQVPCRRPGLRPPRACGLPSKRTMNKLPAAADGR